MTKSSNPAATHSWKKTSLPSCKFDKSAGKWRLYLNFTSRHGQRSCRKGGPRFDSQEAGLAGSLAFRLSWERSKRGRLYEPTEADIALCADSEAAEPTLPAGKSLYSLGKLNAAKESEFRRQRLSGSDMTREEFMRASVLSARERRSIERGWNRRDKKPTLPHPRSTDAVFQTRIDRSRPWLNDT